MLFFSHIGYDIVVLKYGSYLYKIGIDSMRDEVAVSIVTAYNFSDVAQTLSVGHFRICLVIYESTYRQNTGGLCETWSLAPILILKL